MVRRLIESAYDRKNNGEESSLALRRCSDIEDAPISWLWKGVIPMSMTKAITGNAGMSKTFVAADMAARPSRGIPFPTYRMKCLQGRLRPPKSGITPQEKDNFGRAGRPKTLSGIGQQGVRNRTRGQARKGTWLSLPGVRREKTLGTRPAYVMTSPTRPWEICHVNRYSCRSLRQDPVAAALG
jgi:hypothetical protein